MNTPAVVVVVVVVFPLIICSASVKTNVDAFVANFELDAKYSNEPGDEDETRSYISRVNVNGTPISLAQKTIDEESSDSRSLEDDYKYCVKKSNEEPEKEFATCANTLDLKCHGEGNMSKCLETVAGLNSFMKCIGTENNHTFYSTMKVAQAQFRFRCNVTKKNDFGSTGVPQCIVRHMDATDICVTTGHVQPVFNTERKLKKFFGFKWNEDYCQRVRQVLACQLKAVRRCSKRVRTYISGYNNYTMLHTPCRVGRSPPGIRLSSGCLLFVITVFVLLQL